MQEMKYFNEGNDCDICKNQLMTGRDGTVEDCRRRQNGLSCRFEERDIRTCPVCEHEVDREDMYFTKDCHGRLKRGYGSTIRSLQLPCSVAPVATGRSAVCRAGLCTTLRRT